MDTRLVTKNFRLKQWAELIRQRNDSGMLIKDWCEQNHISRNAYFYWQRKLRQAACETSDSGFVEIEIPASTSQKASFHTEIMIQSGDLSSGVSSDTSEEVLRMVLEVAKHAQ